MANIVKDILSGPIVLADQVAKAADVAQSFKQECQDIKAKTDKLSGLLRQAARVRNGLYERPTRRIMDDTKQVLEKALALVIKCRANGIMKRVFTIIPAAAFRKLSMQLENSIGDVSWLLRVSASANDRDDEYLGLPPIAANEPILCLIWEQIAILHTGSLDERADASASLVSLAQDNDRYGKLIIEEGGVPPLLKLAKEGKMDGQENAVTVIGLLGHDQESVEQIVHAGVCSVFAKLLKEGHMKVQAMVAWAISELAANHPVCQDHFAQNNIIRFLVSHLAFETVQEHSKYAIASKHSSIHSVVMARNDQNEDDDVARPLGNQNVATNSMNSKASVPKINSSNQHHVNHTKLHQQSTKRNDVSLSGTSIKGREFEDPATKAHMKAMAARALWHLCKGNLGICRCITESRALLCFAILLEKGVGDVQSYSAMALMEITAVAEQHSDLRRSSFKPTSSAAKAVLEQLLKVIEKEDSDLLIPCIKSIGNLARTFRATETRFTGPLVKLLDEREPEVSVEAAIALNKFVTEENYLRVIHSKAIIEAGGAKHIIQLVYFGEQMVQLPSLLLLCQIALNVPDSQTLAQEKALIVLEWASKHSHLYDHLDLDVMLDEAKTKLEVYQSRVSTGSY